MEAQTLGVGIPEATIVVQVEVAPYAGAMVMDRAANAPNAKSRAKQVSDARLHRLVRDALGICLDTIAEAPLLTATQEVELAKAIELGGYAADLLSLRNPETCEATQTALMDGLSVPRCYMIQEEKRGVRAKNQPLA